METFNAEEAANVGFVPPVTDAEQNEVETARDSIKRALHHTDGGEQYLMNKNKEMAHYLKNLPPGAKKRLAQRNRTKKQRAQQARHTDAVAQALEAQAKHSQDERETKEFTLDAGELSQQAEQQRASSAGELSQQEQGQGQEQEQGQGPSNDEFRYVEGEHSLYDETVPTAPAQVAPGTLKYDADDDTEVRFPGQRYALVSFLRKDAQGRQRAKRDWYRIWCVCSSQKDVQKKLAKIREENPYANWWDIAALPLGGWAPWPPRNEDIKQQSYVNDEMNEFMQSHMENLGRALTEDKDRQKELMLKEDINAQANHKRAEKQKHKRWRRAMQKRAQKQGISFDELVRREAEENQTRIAIEGDDEAVWTGAIDSANPSNPREDPEDIYYEDVEVVGEDGQVHTIRKRKRNERILREEKIKREFAAKETDLLHKIDALALQLSRYQLFLARQGVKDSDVPVITKHELQNMVANDDQIAEALRQQREAWKKEQREQLSHRRK